MSDEWIMDVECDGRGSAGRQGQVTSGAGSLSVLSGSGWISRGGLEVTEFRSRGCWSSRLRY